MGRDGLENRPRDSNPPKRGGVVESDVERHSLFYIEGSEERAWVFRVSWLFFAVLRIPISIITFATKCSHTKYGGFAPGSGP